MNTLFVEAQPAMFSSFKGWGGGGAGGDDGVGGADAAQWCANFATEKNFVWPFWREVSTLTQTLSLSF